MTVQHTSAGPQKEKISRLAKDAALKLYCQEQGLLLGQYAQVRHIAYESYFRTYGICRNSMAWLCEHEASFKDLLQRFKVVDEMKAVDEVVKFYAASVLREEPRFCPQYVHVFERIQEVYPTFSWTVECRPYPGGVRYNVKYVNFPRYSKGLCPSLYVLLTSSDILPPYVPQQRPPKQKRPRRRRREKYFFP